MADKNRNLKEPYRSSGYESNEERGSQHRNFDEEPNYPISKNHGYRNSGRYPETQSDDSGWESRYERQLNSQREGDFDRGNFTGRRQSDSDYNFGTAHRGRNSGYSDFDDDYGSWEGTRNLYDRGYEGINRSDYENRANRLGAANYGAYGYRGRYEQGQPYRGANSGSQNSGYYDRAGYRDRGYGRGDIGERSWWDRTSDEVSSWFGDEGAERRRERDRDYRGKGPRNYSRSDDRIKEDVNDRLSDDPYVDATDIDVAVSAGEVTLTGTVNHRSAKRRAEDIAESISGVKNIENRLRVSQFTMDQNTGFSGKNNPTGASASQSSSPATGPEPGLLKGK